MQLLTFCVFLQDWSNHRCCPLVSTGRRRSFGNLLLKNKNPRQRHTGSRVLLLPLKLYGGGTPLGKQGAGPVRRVTLDIRGALALLSLHTVHTLNATSMHKWIERGTQAHRLAYQLSLCRHCYKRHILLR